MTYQLKELHELLADDFYEFGSSGSIIMKNTVINAVGNNANTDESILFLVTDFAIKLLAPDMLLATCKTERYGDRKRTLRSWIWKIKNGN